MEKINIAELLKDCPKGMELDCTIYDNITFWDIDERNTSPINIKRKDEIIYKLTKYGQISGYEDAKCIIFPKGKTTWEGFHRPFVKGDIVSTKDSMYIGIIKSTEDSHHCHTFCSINDEGDFFYR